MKTEIEDRVLKEMFLDIQMHLINDLKPSVYLNSISYKEEFNLYPFNMLIKMKSTSQSKIHHPEGNVWIHTMMVVDQAAKVKNKSSDITAFMWAALLHDIGKPSTTTNKKGKITSYNHDKVGEALSKEFLQQFNVNTLFIEKVQKLVRWHMQILFVVKSLPFAEIQKMKSEVDINEIALLGLCDRMGRTNASIEQEEENISLFLSKCNDAKVFI